MLSKQQMVNAILNHPRTLYSARILESLPYERVEGLYSLWFGKSEIYEISKDCWFVRRSSDNYILGDDGKWHHTLPCASRVKLYASSGRAQRYGLNGEDGCCFRLFPGESIDRRGNIHAREGSPKITIAS